MAERPEDLNLPAAVVNRIVREALPSNVKVSREANAAVAKAASVFVLYATSCANNVALKANRKTLHGTDVITAMKDMEFHKFVRPLESSLETWKTSQAKKKEESAKRKKEKQQEESQKSAATPTTTDDKENNEEDSNEVMEVDSK